MNESGNVGVIGALLSKTSNSVAGERPETDTSALLGRGHKAPALFGAVFEETAYAEKRPASELSEIGLTLPPSPEAGLPSASERSFVEKTPPLNTAFDAPAPEYGVINVQLPNRSGRHGGEYLFIDENYAEQRVINTSIDSINERLALSDRLGAYELSARPRQTDAPLTTIKLSPPGNAGEEAPVFDLRRDGAPAFPPRNGAAPGVVTRVDTHGALPQFQQTYPEFAPGAERTLESRPTVTEPALTFPRANHNIPAPRQAPVSFHDAHGLLASPAAGQGGPIAITLAEAGPLFDPIASAQGGPVSSVGGPTLVASSTAQSFVAMSGVLPQIQAAVVARNGRDFVEVRLDPPDLGRVRIDFNVENGETIKAVVGAERSETLDHLKRNIADLEQQLKQAGFGSISFEFRNGGDRRFADDHDSFLGLASENTGDAASADIQHKIYLSLRENAQLDLLL